MFIKIFLNWAFIFYINPTQGALSKIISLRAFIIYGEAVWRNRKGGIGISGKEKGRGLVEIWGSATECESIPPSAINRESPAEEFKTFSSTVLSQWLADVAAAEPWDKSHPHEPGHHR